MDLKNDGLTVSGKTKLFNQDEVNKIVEDRLKKEIYKKENLSELKNTLLNLYKNGYFPEFADKKNMPSLSVLCESLMQKLNEKTEKTEKTAHPQTEYAAQSVAATDANPSAEGKIPVDFDNLGIYLKLCTPDILKKISGDRNISFDDAFREYLEFMSILKPQNYDYYAEQMLDTQDENIIRGDLSDRHSFSEAKNHRSDGDFKLTDRQKQLAKAGGMTYREYYDLLNSIPNKKLSK